jgi:PhnB protein
MMVYVDDVDRAFKRAIEAGATELSPVADQFYGDRMGMLRDPFGHEWALATHVEDVPPEELGKRAREAFAQRG